jgi:hypothetical protein
MDRIALVHVIAKVSIELIAIYFHSFEIFVIQIGEMSFWMILKHFNIIQKAFALVRKHRFRALVLQNRL